MKRIAIILPLVLALSLDSYAGVRPIDPKTNMPAAEIHYWVADGLWTAPPVQGWHEYTRIVHMGVWRTKAACEKWAAKEAEKKDGNRSWQCEPVYSPNAPKGGK